jgi:hypothetical protein
MKRGTLVVLAFGLFISSVAIADRLGTDGTSQTFDADFEKVWNAALVALDDKTIDSANKDIGQITTKPEKGHNLTGETSKTIALKISHAKPCKVMVHANIERVTQGGMLGMRGTASMTSTYSDDGLEKDILKGIEKSLAVK